MKSMMMMAGPTVPGFGIGLYVLLMLISSLVYIICAAIIWSRNRNEKNELISALVAFLVYQTFSMVFMSINMQTMNIVYSYIGGLSVLIGSTYMLKFPFYSYSQSTRKTIFILSLIVAVAIFGYFIANPALKMTWMSFILWYDIVVNGLVVGGFMIYLAAKTAERWLKVKAYGGGTGVATCCVAANVTMLYGSILVACIFQFLAPVIILGTLLFARKNESKPVMSANPATV